MLPNIILLAFCILMGWLLFHFALPRAKTPADFRKLFPFFCALTAFVLFNGILAYMGLSGLSLAASGDIVTELKHLAGKKSGDGVILVGTVSSQNDFLYDDYVAYVDESHLWSPKALWIELKQGRIAIGNDTYRASGWPVDALGYAYLRAQQPVTVVALVKNNTGILQGEKSQSLRADLVYAGSHADFAARAQANRLLAGALVLLNLVAALLIVVIPLRECWKGMYNPEA